MAGDRSRGATGIRTRPSVTSPSGPRPGEANAAGLLACVFWTQRAAWIWSFSVTRQPRPRAGADRDPDRRQDVRRPVGPGHRGVAHGAGDHDRRLGGQQQVQGVGGLLDGVRALGDHHPGAAAVQRVADRRGELVQVVEGQRGARLLAEVHDAQAGPDAGQAGHRREQVGRGEVRRHPAARRVRHGDRPAEPEHGHGWLRDFAHRRPALSS